MLAQADIVVCHGGSGTVGQALAADVPLALVPLFADQPHNARRITALGAGVAVWQARPEAIAYAATEVLANPRHRTARSCGG